MTSSAPRHPTILLLDLPQKTFVGIDLLSFDSSPNFHGIVKIPPGYHFLYTGTDATLSVRYGLWLRIDAQSPTTQAHVLRWNHTTESVDLLDSSSDVAQSAIRNSSAVQGRGLVDYLALQDATAGLLIKQATTFNSPSSSGSETWATLTRHITARTLDRILSPSLNKGQGWTISSISCAPSDTETIPGLLSQESTQALQDAGSSTLNFVLINLKQTWPDDAVGRDRTDKARDRSWYLSHLITLLSQSSISVTTRNKSNEEVTLSKQIGAQEILAELQFCYLMVLTLANYSCLEQWKRLLSVVLKCTSALSEAEGFFVEVLKVLRVQLERVEDVDGGLFDLGDEMGSAWLRALLRIFRVNVNEVIDEKVDGLNGELAGLEKWLREQYGWEDEGNLLRRGMVDLEDGERVEVQMDGFDEDEETGEYAPVIVET